MDSESTVYRSVLLCYQIWEIEHFADSIKIEICYIILAVLSYKFAKSMSICNCTVSELQRFVMQPLIHVF